jgi:hypothetical protein
MMSNDLRNTGMPGKILTFFLSLRTAIWLLMALLCLLLYGSFVMPVSEEFQALQRLPLFQWMSENSPGITWWLWAAIAVVSLLTANTLLCSIESVLKKKSARQWMLVISPQVVHIFLPYSAHLLAGYNGFRGAVVYETGANTMATMCSSKNQC